MNRYEPSPHPTTSGAHTAGPPAATPPSQEAPARGPLVNIVLGLAVLSVLAAGGLLTARAESKTNTIALASSPKPVTVITAKAKDYRPSRSYVGTLDSWLTASIGPQLISAYVDTVLVRPGAAVKRGEVLATLDCRDASAESQTVAMEARAIDARQKALASESARIKTLLAGNFVSPNEAEQKAAQSSAEAAQLEAMKAKLSRKSLQVGDCILRAPFDGEIATRTIDPGAFVRPGVSIVAVVDRSTVRFTADAPEVDFDIIAKGREVRLKISATGQSLVGVVARRAPIADPSTRTVRFEVDLPNPARTIPVGTTGEAFLDVGEPVAATEIPIYAAQVRGKRATLFVVEGDVAKTRTVAVKGEVLGSLFLDTDLKPGALVVTEGRALLLDGDRVTKIVATAAPETAATTDVVGPNLAVHPVKAAGSEVVSPSDVFQAKALPQAIKP